MEILVPISLFAMIFGISTVVLYYRYRARQDMQSTIRAVIESGQTLSTDVLEELTTALHPQRSDLRRGVVLVSLGLALVFLGWAIGEEDAFGPLLGVSAFPFFTGLAYLGLWFFNRNA